MVDGITGLTFLYLARHSPLYSIKDNTGALSVFICFTEVTTVPCVSLTRSPLITFSWPLPFCSVTVYRYRSVLLLQHIFLNRHIRAESTSVILVKVDMVEMSSTQSRANSLLTLLGSGCSVHSVSGGFSYVKPVDPLCLKPFRNAVE